ncbi:hypothetical protein BESB_016850 [Besnoitia besnoiti]|uniref:SPRY domain-containing protein n=1 Tax=Besnoitia besnoiti TaxID=94643 RepID=A0A2A9M9U0_BESBE|nr:hypothetical protein BESB_016850 [Besnoitia besnoiti]PFH32367.1 hypothetical protein BESB_016850 [Besnoitia besnoiti]
MALCIAAHRKTTAGVSVDANQVLRGEGLALANVPMEQDRVYFEVHVVEPGRLLVGAARGTAGDSASWSGADYDDLLSQQPPSSRSFVEFGGPDGVAVEKDDVISCAFDQSDFPTSFEVFLNGAPLRDQTLTGEAHSDSVL